MTAERFRNRVAVVTGAASGIGLAISERFAEEQATVALLDSNAEAGRRAAAMIRNRGGRCEFYLVDVASEDQVVSVCEIIQNSFGPVHHLVNNAGIVLVKSIEETTLAEWDLQESPGPRSWSTRVTLPPPSGRTAPFDLLAGMADCLSTQLTDSSPIPY
jgi:NAD(P)-dependent dehydrogenase (short-subunit alcohol dehydrogenase family)